MKKILVILGVGIASCLGAVVESSVLERIEIFESGEALKPSHFSKAQFEEMLEASGRRDERVRVMSFNMLIDVPVANARIPEKHFWENRKARVLEYLEAAQPDVIGAQELMANQWAEMKEALEGVYTFVGVGEEDGALEGQHNGVLFRSDRFEALEERIIWMSETPEFASADPFEKERSLTLVTLRDRMTGKAFVITSCHLSFGSPDSRGYGAKFMAEYLEEESLPVISCGDFNTFPALYDLDRMPCYDGSYVERILTSGKLDDAMRIAVIGHLGPISTFTNASQEDIRSFRGTGTPGVILDHIYVSPEVTVLIHAVDDARVDGEFPSDHMPLIVDLVVD